MAHTAPHYRPRHSGYVSEFTRFIDGYLDTHPAAVESQHKGWYIFWDHKVDLAELERERQDHVPIPPYYYT